MQLLYDLNLTKDPIPFLDPLNLPFRLTPVPHTRLFLSTIFLDDEYRLLSVSITKYYIKLLYGNINIQLTL